MPQLTHFQAGPAFGFAEEKALKPLSWDIEATHRHLLHYLARHPEALLQHVQRINLAIISEDNIKVFCALLDLYLALGAKGRALRADMLSAAMPLLTDEQTAFFLEHLDSGAAANEPHPKAPLSVLSYGFIGSNADENHADSGITSRSWCEIDWAQIALLLG